MARLFRLWFGLHQPVSRLAYALSGFGLMLFKFAVEVLAIQEITGHRLSPLDYLNPLIQDRASMLAGADWLLWVLVVWTLPYLWIGVSMTMRRAEDAGHSPFLALLYFVPGVNYLLMLTLCVLPAQAPVVRRHSVGAGTEAGHQLRSAVQGMVFALAIAMGMVGASVLVFGAYGSTLFLATPFVMGATAAFMFNHDLARTLGATLAVAMLTVFLTAGAILLFALEGVVCLVMAAPVAIAMAIMGAFLGRAIALRESADYPGLAAIVLPLPLLAGIDAGRPPTPPIEVMSVVEIAAPRAVVWRNVVAFPALPEPPEWYFRSGIAYPQSAAILGHGSGAMRRCEFSTGAFVEPITIWDEPSQLAFDVAAQPPPMAEWSPYRHVTTPHLDGYLRVRSGEFRLIALPGDRTRLEGRTVYDVRIFPAAYWRIWSDAFVHAIHRRVLGHIKSLSERGAGTL